MTDEGGSLEPRGRGAVDPDAQGPSAAPPTEGGGESPDRSWSLTSLPWPAAGRALARSPRLLVPVGALVQHGPHLPLGTNTFIAEEVGREVSRRTGVLLAPAFPYGVRVPGPGGFTGSAGLRRKTLHRAMNELLADWEDHGIQEFVLLTAHRHEAHLDALLMALTSSAVLTVVNLFTVDVSDLVTVSPLGEHAGEMETSLMLHLRPEWVRMDQAADVTADPRTHRRYAQGTTTTPPVGARGIVGFPSRASPGKGEAVFRRLVEAVLAILG